MVYLVGMERQLCQVINFSIDFLFSLLPIFMLACNLIVGIDACSQSLNLVSRNEIQLFMPWK